MARFADIIGQDMICGHLTNAINNNQFHANING